LNVGHDNILGCDFAGSQQSRGVVIFLIEPAVNGHRLDVAALRDDQVSQNDRHVEVEHDEFASTSKNTI